MEIIEPGFELVWPTEGVIKEYYQKIIELAARTCYKSEGLIKEGSDVRLIRKIKKRGHESVLEHLSITVRIICDRSTSHQLVRHRLAAYSQESQRYCNYAGNRKGDKGIQVICPPDIANDEKRFTRWKNFVLSMEEQYNIQIELGAKAEDARSVLGNCVKTEVVTTYNLRTWRHVFDMRCDSHAQWQIRGIMTDILRLFYKLCPVVFEDKVEKFGIREENLDNKPLPVPEGYDHTICPECGQVAVSVCKCMRADCTCDNGHSWHTCPVHKVKVKGESDHSTVTMTCTCGKEQLDLNLGGGNK